MRSESLLLLALLVGVTLGTATASRAEPEPEVVKLWRQNCATCHTVPDPTLAADRAWIDQVERTA